MFSFWVYICMYVYLFNRKSGPPHRIPDNILLFTRLPAERHVMCLARQHRQLLMGEIVILTIFRKQR